MIGEMGMSEWMSYTLVICGGIITILTLWNMVEQRIKSNKMPTSNLEERVALLERKLEFEVKGIFTEYDARFGRDKQKIEAIEEGNRVTQQALLALLEHSIDGNNTEALKKAKADLSNYLIHK